MKRAKMIQKFEGAKVVVERRLNEEQEIREARDLFAKACSVSVCLETIKCFFIAEIVFMRYSAAFAAEPKYKRIFLVDTMCLVMTFGVEGGFPIALLVRYFFVKHHVNYFVGTCENIAVSVLLPKAKREIWWDQCNLHESLHADLREKYEPRVCNKLVTPSLYRAIKTVTERQVTK